MKKIESKKVLIFGVTGNCGRYVAEKLLAQDCEVFGVGRSMKPKIKQLKYIKGDICDKDLYDKLPTNVDLVINLAGVQPSILPTSENTNLAKTLETYVKINILGVFNIIEFVRKNNISTYIYTTTHRDYELHWGSDNLLGNNLPVAINYKGDHSMYAISKTSAKMMGDYYAEAFGIRVFNLRLPMIFLVPEDPEYLVDGKPRLMPFLKVIKDALSGSPLEIWGDPELKRDYVHIDNLMALIELSYRSDLERGTFSVGTGEGVTTEKFIKTIAEVFSPDLSRQQYKYCPEKRTYKCAVYDVREQKELLGYEPVLLKEMLLRLKKEMELQGAFKKWGWE